MDHFVGKLTSVRFTCSHNRSFVDLAVPSSLGVRAPRVRLWEQFTRVYKRIANREICNKKTIYNKLEATLASK